MKKLLFLIAIFCYCGSIYATNYCQLSNYDNGNIIKSDDFDNYYNGPISNQSNHWSTYSGYPANIVSHPYHSAGKSMKVEYSSYHTEGVKYTLGYNSNGQFKLSFYMYVPSNKTGSYRLNNSSDAMSYFVRFNVNSNNYLDNGTGTIYVGNEKEEFDFPTNQWFKVVQIFDLNSDEVKLVINGRLAKVMEFNYNNVVLKDVRFFTADNYSKFYVDDVCFGTFNCYATNQYSPVCANGYEFSNSSVAQCYGITHYDQGGCGGGNNYCCPQDPWTQSWYLNLIEDLRDDCHNGYGPRVFCATYYGQKVISVEYKSYGGYYIDHPFGYVYDCNGNLLFQWTDGWVQQNLDKYNALYGEELLWDCNDEQDCYQVIQNCHQFDYELLPNNHLGLSANIPGAIWSIDGQVVNTQGNEYFVYDCGNSEYVEVAIIYHYNGCTYKCIKTIQCNPYYEDPCCYGETPQWLNHYINNNYYNGQSLTEICNDPYNYYEPSIYCCTYNGQSVYRVELKNGNSYLGKVFTCSGNLLFSYSHYQNQYYYNLLDNCQEIWSCDDVQHPNCGEYGYNGENCDLISYEWDGHNLHLGVEYGDGQNVQIDHWEIDGYEVPTDAYNWTYTPPACGTYTICCYYWYNGCLLKCCKTITCNHPWDDCCTNDPLSLPWLSDFIADNGEDFCSYGCGMKVYCATYYGQPVIEIQTPPYGSGCTDAMGQVFTCDGQYLFAWGGIAGLPGYNHIQGRQLIWDCDELQDCDYLYEDFEGYNNHYITPQAPHWVTFEGGQGTNEDAYVTTFGGDKALKIYDDNPYGAGYDDVICKWGNQSEGIYEIEWKMYVQSGYSGYFNLQKYNNSFTGGGYVEVYFYTNGTGKLKVGGNTYYSFYYNPNQWMHIKFRIDTDNNLLYFTPNGGSWKAGLNYGSYHLQLGGCNYYAYNYAKFYVDDIYVTRYDCQDGYNLNAEEQTVETDILRAEASLETADVDLQEVASFDETFKPDAKTETATTNELQLMNYPNPFTTQTTLQFDLAKATEVSLEIVNTNGQVIWTQQGTFDAGRNEVIFDETANLPTGTYIARITTADATATQTMIKVERP